MKDIKEVLEMFEPTQDVIDNLQDRTYYVVLVKKAKAYYEDTVLLRLHFQRFNTVPPKFIDTYNQVRYTKEDIEYIFKIKEK